MMTASAEAGALLRVRVAGLLPRLRARGALGQKNSAPTISIHLNSTHGSSSVTRFRSTTPRSRPPARGCFTPRKKTRSPRWACAASPANRWRASSESKILESRPAHRCRDSGAPAGDRNNRRSCALCRRCSRTALAGATHRRSRYRQRRYSAGPSGRAAERLWDRQRRQRRALSWRATMPGA